MSSTSVPVSPRRRLAAIPPDPAALAGRGPAARLAARLIAHAAGDGRARFKRDFAPRTTPLYLAAHGRAGLVLSGLAIRRQIVRPPPPSPVGDSASAAGIMRRVAG